MIQPATCASPDAYDGWIALRNAADNEPRMMEVLGAWAVWRYGLDKVADADTAWQAFERIGEEADVQQQYLTPSVAGRAVELLVPKLPQERLLDKASKLIRNTGSFQYFKWDMNGRLQFGYSQRQGGVSLGRSSEGWSSGGRAGSPQFPMSGFPVAHAVWMLYESQPNVIQRRIAPEIIRWQYQAGLATPLVIAACFGGPDIDQFLLRQNWHADPHQLEREERVWLMGRDGPFLFVEAGCKSPSRSMTHDVPARALAIIAPAASGTPLRLCRLRGGG